MLMAFFDAIDCALVEALRFRYLPTPAVWRFCLLASSLVMPLLGWMPSAPVATAQSTSPDSRPGEAISVAALEGALDLVRFLKEETVITAVRHEQPISQSPSNIYVITAEDIRHSGATDIPTLLRRIPGIEVVQMTGADFNVSARDDNQPRANKMLILVDGRSVYLDVQGEVLWKVLPVTLAEIERIEVLKGPASALYGFNAFDGVVNIITKSLQAVPSVTLQLGGGEIDTFTASALYAGTYGKLGYRLSVGWDQNAQWRDQEALALRAYKFNLQTAYALSSHARLLVSGGFVDANRFDGPIVENVIPLIKLRQEHADVSYERPNFFLRGYWTGTHESGEVGVNPRVAPFFRITDRHGNPHQSLDWDSYNVEAQHALEFGTVNRLTYGINYRYTGATSNFLDAFSRENRLGLYVQDEWHITPAFTAVAGVRYDLHSEITPTLSPRFALLYKLSPNHTLRTAVAVAFRPPTIFETHTDSRGVLLFVPPPFNTTALLGSRNLDPERVISYDVSYQGWFFKHRLRLRADFFLNHISDLISSVSAAVGKPPQFVNGGEADIYGGEVGIEFLATPWLTGFLNYAYQESNQSFTGTARRGGPQSKANAGLRGEWNNGLSGEVALHYVGSATYEINRSFTTFASLPGGVAPPDTQVGSYALLNLRAAYRFWHDRAEVAFTAFNVLNDRHKEHPLGDTIGRRMMGWLTLKY